MNIETLKKALKEETSLFANENFNIVEIGNGNINRVFRVTTCRGQTYIIKCAQKNANISNSIRLNLTRGKTEYAYLQEISQLMPARVPNVYAYSARNHYIVMQDMAPEYSILQDEIISGRRYDFLAKQLADYIAVAGYMFSDFSVVSVKKKQLQKNFFNPKLCELTERLVFTEPFFECENNCISDLSYDFVRKEIYSDQAVTLSAARLKYKFMNLPQSLIHGDLHFGSVFISNKDIVIFDSEFCCFGPIGYDLGNLLAHFILHYIYAKVTHGANAEPVCLWLKQQAVCLVEEFEKSFLQKVRQDPALMFGSDSFVQAFLENIMRDTAGYAGTECIRRIVGLAKVSVFRFKNEIEKSQYEMQVLSVGKYLLTHFDMFISPNIFKKQLNKLLR